MTLDGAKNNYGVVVRSDDFTVDTEATEKLRADMKAARPATWADLTYNRGGTLDEILAEAELETGMKPPRPLWEEAPYGPHVALPYVKEWYKKMREQKGFALEDTVRL